MKTQRSIPGVDDGKELANLKESMSKVDIDAKDQVPTDCATVCFEHVGLIVSTPYLCGSAYLS